MGFLRKNKHNIQESTANQDTDTPPSRKKFHEMAEEHLQEALNRDAEQNHVPEDDFMDDFSFDTEEESAPVQEDEPTVIEKPKEKPQRATFGEFCRKHKKGVNAIIIAVSTVFLLCLAVYIYGCLAIPPSDVMGRNIYIEDINVSGLTYEEALAKLENTSLLHDKDITITNNGKKFIIDGVEAGLTARLEDTVSKAMRYGKTKSILIDGLANALQFFHRHTVVPSADVDEAVIREKLTEFGNIVYGELKEHTLEVGEDYIICTPGKTGFSGDVDTAYNQILEAIDDENYTDIHVSLQSKSPKPCTLEDLDAFTYTDPADAKFEIVDGDVKIIQEVYGRYLDLEEAKPLIAKLSEGGDVIKIPYYKTEPEITSAELEKKLFNGTIASYSTNYAAGGNRGANVARAASQINGKVLLPGDVFSFNDAVGPRSAANGFYSAPEYANGETVIGIGGGTCQVSTTLYNAVLYSDLSIVSKLNHMFPVGYAPIGQDATVSDSGVDFKFMNNMDYPIKISAVTGGGKVTVSIIGTLRDVPHNVKIENITRNVGADKSVHSYRYVYDNKGTLIRKDDLGSSYYIAHKQEESSTASTPVVTAPQNGAASPSTAPQAPASPQTPAAVPNEPAAPVTPQAPTVDEILGE